MPAPAARCRVCAKPFARTAYRDLHLVQAHPGQATQAERTAHREAHEHEEAVLAGIRRHVRGGLAALPVVGLYLVVVVFTGLLVGGNPGLMFLPLPFTLLVSAFVYYLAYTHEEQAGAA